KHDVHEIFAFPSAHRVLSSVQLQTDGEKRIGELLQERFPRVITIDVSDVSGGCGSMHHIVVGCDEFHSLPKAKQHRMVTDTLKKEIASMHGIVIETLTPK
ncbi:unnamed protein product, partial [Toxocara canis]|uniref:BOLA3 protein n=1 Tax=Toxocara canis TaxID=6265 RepID=A0A183UCT7_TOXCA